jgi:hypothetical protein
MPYRPGDIVRGALVGGLPVAGGALASYGELAWGAAALAALLAVRPLRRYAAAVGAVFGLLVLARLGQEVVAGGAAAVVLGFGAVAGGAYLFALRRRGERDRLSGLAWAAGWAAVASLAAAATATLLAPPATLNAVLVPAAAFAAVAAVPLGKRWPRLPLAALAVGLALGGLRGAAGAYLTYRGEEAWARGDAGAAEEYAAYGAALGAGARADLLRLRAAAARGASAEELEALARKRDRTTSPRPLDAALARAAFARADYETAAKYADLATTSSPTSAVRDRPVSREELHRDFEAEADGPFAAAWATLWIGRYEEAAREFAALAAEDPHAAWYEAFAWERAGRPATAAGIYEELWARDKNNFRAGFGLLRTADRHGLRGEIWRNLGRCYSHYYVGAKLDAADGFPLSKHRLSLGRSPARLTFTSGGRRRLALLAESSGGEGLYPLVTLTVNGEPAESFYLAVPGENIYETEVDLPPGENEIAVLFENDYADADRGLDRNVFVREIRLSRESR